MNEDSWLRKTELPGRDVTLLPLSMEHADDLAAAAADGELWRLWFTSIPNEQEVAAYIDQALIEYEKGRALPFVVRHNASGAIIGTTRLCNADVPNRRLEIGYTWYAQRYQRSAVNTECKYLLLRHAFETLQTIAVEFRTHWHNQRSRAAIARLGAKQDGVLRNHQIMADGSYRDTVVFSIIEQEWPAVKRGLLFRMNQSD